MKFKKTIAVDFDGVLNNYTGYDPHNLFTPRSGVEDFLKTLNKQYEVIIYSTRNKSDIEKWLIKYHLDKYIQRVTNKKPPAVAYIDDRAVRFNGDYSDCLEDLDERAYWQKKED